MPEARARRGSALVASLMVVVVVAGLGVCMLRMHNSVSRRQSQAIDRKRAFYVAEAGLSEAFLAVSQGKSGNVASEDLPASFGDGVYWVSAEEGAGGTVALTSTGLVGGGRFALTVTLRSQLDPVASRGIFARDLMVVESGTVIDGYDSRRGTYEQQARESGDPTHTESGASISCNSDVFLESEVPAGRPGQEVPGMTMVFGDVRPGPGASAIMDPGVLVTGSTAPSSDAGVLPSIELPTVPSQGDLVQDTDSLTLGLTERRYDLLRVRSGSELRIRGPARIVAGGFWLESGARLVLDSQEGPVRIYCRDFIDFQPDSVITDVAKDPLSVSLFVASRSWVDHDGDGVADPPAYIRSRGEFYGFLYAPQTMVVLPRTLRFYGAVAAQKLRLEAGTRFTVDRALASGENGVSSLPELVAWQIAPLPDSPLVKLRLDPRTVLQRNGLEPPPSSEAPSDKFMDVAYFDTAGSYRTFTGSEDEFDWHSVGSLVSVDWRRTGE